MGGGKEGEGELRLRTAAKEIKSETMRGMWEGEFTGNLYLHVVIMLLRIFMNKRRNGLDTFKHHGRNLLWAATATAAVQGARDVCNDAHEVEGLRLKPIHGVCSSAHSPCRYEQQ